VKRPTDQFSHESGGSQSRHYNRDSSFNGLLTQARRNRELADHDNRRHPQRTRNYNLLHIKYMTHLRFVSQKRGGGGISTLLLP